jgi:cytochrome P450
MASYLEQFDQTPAEGRWRLVRRWMFEEPLPFYAELRLRRPILEMPELTLVTRYYDCARILHRDDTFGVDLYKPKQGDYFMDQDDTAVHWREKSIMKAILDFEQLPAIRGYVADKAASILKAAGGAIEAVGGLTRAVPIALVQDWFGFTDSDPKDLFEWSYWNQIDTFWNQPFDSVAVADQESIVKKREEAIKKMGAYLVGLVEKRGAELLLGVENSDPATRLLRLSKSGAVKFDVARVVLNTGGLLIGAVETTSHAAINALEGLLASPSLLAGARAAAALDDPHRFDGYVFEAMRFKPAFPYFFRTCHRPTVLSGGTEFAKEIQPGTTVLAVTHSAMFDPAVFADPDRFDPARPLLDMFHFGYGSHECLGRAIGALMIPEIVRQCLLLPDLRADGPVDYRGGPVPEAYQLRWSAAAVH